MITPIKIDFLIKICAIYKTFNTTATVKNLLVVIGMFFFFGLKLTLAQIPINGLVASYPFNGNTNDQSGNGNNGNINGGVSLTTDRYGRIDSAYFFDGTGEITIPDATSLRPANAVSLVAWVFLIDTTIWPNILCKSLSLSDPFHSYILGTDNWTTNTQWAFGVSNGGAGSLVYTDEPSGVGMNQWVFLAATYDGAYVKIYMNGILVKKEPKTGAIGYSTLPLRIGTAGSGANFTGKIDDVLIYDRALSDCEINQIYNVNQPAALAVSSIVTDVTCFGGADGTIDLSATGGVINGCLSFDGANDLINIGFTDRASNSFTMEAWFKAWGTHEIDLESTSGFAGISGQRYLFGPVNEGVNAATGVSVGTNGISVYEHGTGYMPAVAVYSGNIGTGWNHVAIVYNNKIPSIYLNGVLVHTGLLGTKPIVFSSLAIGGEFYGYHAGLIDEARIWNKAFSASEVLNSYNSCIISPNDPNYANLIGYWNMNEGAGPIINDISGTANNGVLNGPLWQGQDSVTYGCNNNLGYDFLWSNAEITEDIINLSADIFLVTVTDGNGCTFIDSIEVFEPGLVPADAGLDTSICSDTSVIFSASGGINYVWSPGAGLSDSTIFNPIATPLITTSYVVTVTDSLSCTNTDTIVLTINNIPNPIITSFDSLNICEGDSVILLCSSASSYLWTTGDTGQSIIIDTSGSFAVIVIDSNGCSATSPNSDVIVYGITVPSISANGNTTFCQGDSVILNSSASSLYIWNTGETSQSIVIDSSGSYSVSVTDTNGCTGTSMPILVSVNQNPDPIIYTNGPISFCDGDSVTLTSDSAMTYLWSTGDTTSNINVVTSNSFTVTVLDSNGCIGTSSPTIVVSNPLPIIDSISVIDESGCSVGDGSVTIFASSGTSPLLYSLDSGTTFIGNNNFLNLSSGIYSIYVTDSSNCTVQGPTAVITAPGTPPIPLASADASYCAGESISDLSAIGLNIEWFSDIGLANSIDTGSILAISPAIGTTVYYVTQTVNGCQSLASTLTIIVNPTPSITVSNDTTIELGQSTLLIASGAESYIWSPSVGLSITSGPSVIATPNSTTTYLVSANDSNGCAASASVTVAILLSNTTFYIPNTFSPVSRISENSRLHVFGHGIASLELIIYNRWGEVVYKTNDVEKYDGHCCAYGLGWDGNYLNAEMPINTAVFVFKLNGIFINGEEFSQNGNITLIK